MSVLFGELVSRLKSASSPSEREGKLYKWYSKECKS